MSDISPYYNEQMKPTNPPGRRSRCKPREGDSVCVTGWICDLPARKIKGRTGRMRWFHVRNLPGVIGTVEGPMIKVWPKSERDPRLSGIHPDCRGKLWFDLARCTLTRR